MKANELMIGDWVFCEGQPTPSNVTIQTIAEDGVWFIGDKFEGAASYDRIFPIPLTPKILEKNGFGDVGTVAVETRDTIKDYCTDKKTRLGRVLDTMVEQGIFNKEDEKQLCLWEKKN